MGISELYSHFVVMFLDLSWVLKKFDLKHVNEVQNQLKNVKGLIKNSIPYMS
jgi:hypothetical protein